MSGRRMAVMCARVRMPLLWCGVALLFGGSFVFGGAVSVAGTVVFVVAMALYLRVGTVRRPPVFVRPPVRGRWVAVNSPASRVPSHGMHAYGQTYAVDLVHEPADGSRPGFGWWPVFRPAADFPGFGEVLHAPADGVVARVHRRERDHLSRNSWPALVYLLVEGMVRELFGPARILGNHVVIDHGDGVYSALAHLRRGSIRVRPGQRVAVGEPVAECGNSGNSTEPHVHFQLMDHPRALLAAGLPFGFAGVPDTASADTAGADAADTDGGAAAGVPRNKQSVTVPVAVGADR